jgi:capsular polysaccharide transport system ATP-binding protein
MIRLESVNRMYATRSGAVHVLRDVNLSVARGDRVGILGRNGAGKSTLIRLISGAELPSSGHVERHMSVSWPLAFGGAFQGALTGIDNLRFICRVYGVDPDGKLPFVEDFSELGLYLREPVKTYSSGMRARLAFALSMIIEFDCFLIDEIIAVGDSRFHEKCNHELFAKRGDRAMIIVSHDAGYIREHCTRAAVLKDGRLYHHGSLDEAFEFYHEQAALAA